MTAGAMRKEMEEVMKLMNEHTLTEERGIDTKTNERGIETNLTTASLAGVDQRAEREEFAGSTVTEMNAADSAAGNTFDKRTAAQKTTHEETSAPLFPSSEAAQLRTRWDAVQVAFVDEPRQAVEQADALVAGAMKRLAQIFAEERARLEGQWDRGDSISTEDLRLALRRYRSFFGRMLAV